MYNILLVGFGNMGKALARALGGSCHLYVLEKQEEKLQGIASLDAKPYFLNEGSGPVFDFVFLAVKPQDFYADGESLKQCISDDTVVVSIMAGVSISSIKARLGARYVARTMPNLPMKYNQGVIAVAKEHCLPESKASFVLDVFSSLGYAFETQEDKLDAITAISGSGPAYFLLFMDVLASYAREKGIDESQIRNIVSATAKGAAALLDNSEGTDIKGLINAIASKGGTTEAALSVMRYKGVPTLFREAVNAAYLRSKELLGQ